MATATANTKTHPVKEVLESISLVLSPEEALYVTSELAGSNSYLHGSHNNVYDELYSALGLSFSRNRFGYKDVLKRHVRVSTALRPGYEYGAALEVAHEEDLLP